MAVSNSTTVGGSRQSSLTVLWTQSLHALWPCVCRSLPVICLFSACPFSCLLCRFFVPNTLQVFCLFCTRSLPDNVRVFCPFSALSLYVLWPCARYHPVFFCLFLLSACHFPARSLLVFSSFSFHSVLVSPRSLPVLSQFPPVIFLFFSCLNIDIYLPYPCTISARFLLVLFSFFAPSFAVLCPLSSCSLLSRSVPVFCRFFVPVLCPLSAHAQPVFFLLCALCLKVKLQFSAGFLPVLCSFSARFCARSLCLNLFYSFYPAAAAASLADSR